MDIVIRNGTVATASDTMQCDVAIAGDKIVGLGHGFPRATHEIDATGKLVLPGAIDAHTHIEQRGSLGVMIADDFYSGTVSAAFGGTTTVLAFAAQHRGESLRKAVDEYFELARTKAVIDYGFHLIVSDPTPETLERDLPALIEEGYSSFKVYMTYDKLRLADRQILEIMTVARERGALVMVHAENHDMIHWLRERLVDRGHVAPRYHAVSHPKIAEGEATRRAISLARLIDVPMLVVHVSTEDGMDEIRAAQTAGLKVYAETCPQYLFLTGKDLDRDGMEGAKFCCSPPLRDERTQQAIWRGIANGTFQIVSSDHAPYRFDATGKLAAGPRPTFIQIANGIPGVELRAPLMFSEGVAAGRIDLNRFVAITATNPAKLYGLYPNKGTIAIGADADIAIWDPTLERTVTHTMLHDAAGYTPYEGRRVRGWPITVLSRGRIAVDDQLQIGIAGERNVDKDEPTLERHSGAHVAEDLEAAA